MGMIVIGSVVIPTVDYRSRDGGYGGGGGPEPDMDDFNRNTKLGLLALFVVPILLITICACWNGQDETTTIAKAELVGVRIEKQSKFQIPHYRFRIKWPGPTNIVTWEDESDPEVADCSRLPVIGSQANVWLVHHIWKFKDEPPYNTTDSAGVFCK